MTRTLAQKAADSSKSTMEPWEDAFERELLAATFLKILADMRKNGYAKINEQVVRWYTTNREALSLAIPALDELGEQLSQNIRPETFAIKLSMDDVTDRPQRAAISPTQQKLDWIRATLKLSAEEAELLNTVYRFSQFLSFTQLLSAFDEINIIRDEVNLRYLAPALGMKRPRVKRLVGRHTTLQQLGLIEDRAGEDYAPSRIIIKLLEHEDDGTHKWEEILLGSHPKSTLTLADFDHMATVRDDVVNILKGALDSKAKGIGILFYGAPGTGKTEFATLLAAACEARVVFVGESDEEQEEPNRYERLAHLSLLSALGERAGRVVAVVDEADDIFAGVDSSDRMNRTGSKVFMNRLVESSSLPIIWITNNTEQFGEAILRRMVRAVEFNKPDRQVRRRIIERHADKYGLGLDDQEKEALAQLPAAPAILASALRASSLGGGSGKIALSTARSMHQALTGKQPAPDPHMPVAFDASLSSADTDLKALEEKVAAIGPKALSFLFVGLPGTGKSAFARHLAERLGMDVMHQRASDLLNMYVGESEKNIARAFQKAAESNQFLIIDEADSLLYNRQDATRSWEVTQVNEMLTWMESHPLPFAATTNFSDRLDPAVFRRFLFKVKFEAMTSTQIAMAFERYFDRPAPEEVLRLDPLTPGDFSIVARKIEILGPSTTAEIAHMLADEVKAKPNATKPIGFV
ncbi:AAA family ATPase [Bartonella sp. LJL80]